MVVYDTISTWHSDLHVATLALTGMLLLLLKMAYTLIRYSMPGSSSVRVADVLSPGTVNSWYSPPGAVGTWVTRYSVTNMSFVQFKSTVSVVISVTVRSLGGETEERWGEKINFSLTFLLSEVSHAFSFHHKLMIFTSSHSAGLRTACNLLRHKYRLGIFVTFEWTFEIEDFFFITFMVIYMFPLI